MSVETTAAFAERVRGHSAEFAQCVQSCDAGRFGATPDLGVQRYRVFTQFAHVAQHQPALTAGGSQRIDRRMQRTRIGVVAVVDQGRATREAMRVQSAHDRLRGVQTRCNHLQCDACAQRQRCGRERIQYVVTTRHRDRDIRFALRRHQHEARTFGIERDVACGHVGGCVQAETDQSMAVRAFGEIRGEGIVGVDGRNTVGGQRIVDRGFGIGDTQQTAHALDMCGRDVVDQRHIGTHDRGEIRDIARPARAHFVNRVQRIVRRIDHCQRQTDFVVAIARRAVGATGHALRCDRSFENREDQCLHAGLAVTAGHCQHFR